MLMALICTKILGLSIKAAGCSALVCQRRLPPLQILDHAPATHPPQMTMLSDAQYRSANALYSLACCKHRKWTLPSLAEQRSDHRGLCTNKHSFGHHGKQVQAVQ